MRVAAALVAVAVLAGCSTDPTKADRSDAVVAKLDAGAPGCAAAVSVDGRVVWQGARGVASLKTKAAIDEHTVFDIASVSKQLTATAVLLLVQSGDIDLDVPLRKYLPDLPAWADRTTIAELLHHTSGIPDYVGLLDADFADRTTVDDAVAALQDVKQLDFAPGSQFSYSNSGYFLLSLVVDSVMGEPLAKYLAANVFRPLHLDMAMDATPTMAHHATSYDGRDDATSRWEQTGDGAVQTTPVQLVRWATQYWDPTLGGRALLHARTADAVDDGDGERYGAGIFIGRDHGRTVFSHDGAWEGFVTDFVVWPSEHLAAAVTCNEDHLDSAAMADRLIAIWRA